MERRIGEYPALLPPDTLAELQREIVSERASAAPFPDLGCAPRLCSSARRIDLMHIVHYVAPHWDRLRDLLHGLEVFLERTAGQSSVIRAGAAAFVFIHPLADGNGRIHRFIFNDVLRREGAVPRPFILPISTVMTLCWRVISLTNWSEMRAMAKKQLLISAGYRASAPLQLECNGHSIGRIDGVSDLENPA